jgi:hypothetical protein
MTRFVKDLVERVGWTALQAGVAVITVDSLGLPVAWAAPAAAVLAFIKALVARHVGRSDSASTFPSI